MNTFQLLGDFVPSPLPGRCLWTPLGDFRPLVPCQTPCRNHASTDGKTCTFTLFYFPLNYWWLDKKLH